MAASMLTSQVFTKLRFCNTTTFTRNIHFFNKRGVGNSIRVLGTRHFDSGRWHHQRNFKIQLPVDDITNKLASRIDSALCQTAQANNNNDTERVYFNKAFKPPSPCSGEYLLKPRKGSYGNLAIRQQNYSEERRTDKVPLRLMDFPEIVWPSALKSLKNWILAHLIITPYFDREFSLPEFIKGSKKAVEMVSESISQNNFEHLRGLVDPDATRAVQRSITTFSVQQRQELKISQDDIYFCFPYQVGVMLSDDEDNPKRFVEITMCYHTLQGLNDMRNQGKTPPINMGMIPEYRDKISICNYRFIREYTKGVEDQWTVNVINHFKPSDYVT